jgi:hypothetical protein
LPDLLAQISERAPPYLLISGDVTDRGLKGELDRVLDALKRISGHSKIILAPGNHDLSEVCGISLGDDRLMRFLRAQELLFPKLRTASGASLDDGFAAESSPGEPAYRLALEKMKKCAEFCLAMPQSSEILGVERLGNRTPRVPEPPPVRSLRARRSSPEIDTNTFEFGLP